MEREPGWWVIEDRFERRTVAYLARDMTLFPCVAWYDSHLPPGMYEHWRFVRRFDIGSLEFEAA